MSAATISKMSLDLDSQEQEKVNTGIVGHELGVWFRKHKNNLLVSLFVLLCVYMIYGVLTRIAEAETTEANASIIAAAAAYTNSIRHKKCQSRGGCSRKCQYITRDDPRVVMCNQVDGMEVLNNMLRQGLTEDVISLETAVSRLSATAQAKIAEELQSAQAIKIRSSSNVSAIVTKAKSLDQQYGSSEAVTVDVINAKNRIAALDAAATINKYVYIAAVIHAASCVMNARVQDISATDQPRVDNYDGKTLESQINSAAIKEYFETLSATTADSTASGTYSATLIALTSDSIASNDIIAAMANLMNTAKDTHLSVENIRAKFSVVLELFDTIARKVDSFSNDLPGGAIDSEQVSGLIANGDYNTAVIRTALEPEIVSNHQKFAKERATFDSGGGVPSVRDDDNDVVKWVGLFGRPTYRRSDGSSVDKSSEPLRSIPSDVPENLMRKNTPRLSFA